MTSTGSGAELALPVCLRRFGRRRSAAVHEAGHAAAAWLLGIKVKGLTLGADRDEGAVDLGGYGRRSGDPGAVEDRAVVLLIGSETERVWAASTRGAPDDWLGRMRDGRLGDMSQFRQVAALVAGPDDDRAHAWYTHVRGRALKATGRRRAGEGDASYWDLVGDLAGTLLEAGELSGAEARRILADGQRLTREIAA